MDKNYTSQTYLG